MKTGIVILAAGESSRMGEPKQLLAFHGRTLLQHAIATSLELGAEPVVAVLGANAEQIRAQIDEHGVQVVENLYWYEGMGSSLRSGLRALLAAHPETDGVIFLPCDQPLLTTATLRELITTHEHTGMGIVASEYDGTLGTPAFFARSFFPELLALDGTAGARQIIWRHGARTIGVPFPGGAMDMDTPADYARLQQTFSEIPATVTI